MLITDLPRAEQAFWMGVLAVLDAEAHTEVASPIAMGVDTEEPDIDALLAILACQAAAAEA